MSKEIANIQTGYDQLNTMFKASKAQIEKALAGAMDPEQFIRVALTAWRRGGDQQSHCCDGNFACRRRGFGTCSLLAELGAPDDVRIVFNFDN